MKTILFLTMIFLPWMQETDEKAEAIKIAERMLEFFVNEEFENFTPLLDDRLKELIPIDKMKEAKQGLNADVGVFVKKSETKAYIEQGHIVVEILCHFETADVIYKVYINDKELVSGMGFFPTEF